MERTTYPKRNDKFLIPDAINASVESNYTQIPNSFLRNPEISGKAKALLCLLLSNNENWHSCIETISTMMKEQRDAILSGLNELKKFGYFTTLKYRDLTTKQIKGNLWVYTNKPHKYNLKKHVQMLYENGLEVISPETGKPYTEKPYPENPVLVFDHLDKPDRDVQKAYNNTNKNNNKNININTKKTVKKSSEDILPYFLNLFPRQWKNNSIFRETIIDFIEHRKDTQHPLTERGCKIIANKCTNYSMPITIEAVNRSIECDWTGVFPESIKQNTKKDFNDSRNEPYTGSTIPSYVKNLHPHD